MSEGKKLQHDKEEAEFLRKRSWDLIELLDKMESQLNTSDDKDERHSLQIRISNTRRLLEDYESEYKFVCSEASIPSEIIGTGESNDISSLIIRNININKKIDLPTLFLVPARNKNFLGRNDDVKKFVQLVLDSGAFAICGVKGMGGIGKTEIAREICHIFHETWNEHPDLPEHLTDLLSKRKFFQDGILWIQFSPEGQTPKTLTNKLISLITKEYLKNLAAEEKQKKSKNPAKEKENLKTIQKLNLDTLADALTGKNMLVVLDSVEQNLRTFDYVLERFKGRFTLLITSRIAIPGIQSIDINVLADEDAEKLFLSYMKKDNQQLTEEERKIVQELCKLPGNYPLLIKIIASQVKADNSNLAELLKKYQKNPAQMLDEYNDSLCIDHRHVNARACFMMSFNMLNDKQQDVFLQAALFNNPFTVEALSALLDDMDKDNMLHIVEQIESLSLINRLDGKDGLTTYELHPLMRELALDLLMKPVKKISSATKVKNETLLKELQQAQEEKTLSEQLKNDRSLVKKAIEAGQYFDQVFAFDLVLNLMQVLDGKLGSIISLDKRLLLNKLAIRAAVALQQDEYEKHYRKKRVDMEKTQKDKNNFKFVGREGELKDFENEFLFRSGSFILNIHTDGQGGVGKTQLLQQMLKICRSKYADKMISCDELIDFYYTESRSKAGIIDQIIRRLGVDYFPNVAEQIEKYYQTKDHSEQQYILDDAVTSLRRNYEVFAALWEQSGKIIILFFDTYEVIQFIDKDKNIAERSDFSEWLEKELFPALQSDNTRLVIAGRYPLIDAAKESAVATKLLDMFKDEEAVAFLTERLKKVAEFSKEKYQLVLSDFPQADRLLQPFRDDLAAEPIRVRIYEFPNGHRKELGEEVWLALKNNVPSKGKKELLEELKLTEKELDIVIELAGKRPIYLALFMDWVHLSNGEPSKLVKNAQNIGEELARKELFENTILEWLWNDADKREYLYHMTVAYRRITADIMQHLTGDSLKKCEKILIELRHLSFVKCKEDEQNGDIILLHDEMRELIVNRWAQKIDPEHREKKEILKNLICYYKKNLLSKNYSLKNIFLKKPEEFNIPKHIFDMIKNMDSLYYTEGEFVADLQKKCGLTQEEFDSYSSTILHTAAQEVSQEKREVYTPELQEYAFIANADSGAQFFCDEFDIAMDDGRYTYAGLLGREAVACRKKYGASKFYELQIELRDVQHYIDSSKPNIKKALDIIKKVNERQHHDKTRKNSLLYGQFTLWAGIAEFWQDNFDNAIELMKKANSIFINYDRREELIYLADNWTGYTYYRKADFIQAESWMKISLDGLIELLSKELNDDNKRRRKLQQSIQYTLGNFAMLYRYTGKFIEAIRYAEIQLNIVKSLPRNKKEILRSLNTLSHVLAIAGRNVDGRCYLEEAEGIYKEIPDRLLGGRLYSTFCQLSYGTMEFANLLECYRAEDLHRAVENSNGKHVQEYIEYAEEAIRLLEQEPVFHKELADAYFSLGEMYMMMPANHPDIQKKGDKWELAKHGFEKAQKFAKKSQFQYRFVDTLVSLVTLYYFQSQTKGISLEQKKECVEKQKDYQNAIESDWKIKQYPNLAGRYELIQGDIHFDKALEKLKAEYPKANEGYDDLLKAFNHYIRSAACKKKFNKNRYYLMLRIIYNRLDKLVELAHPLRFSRLEYLDYEQQEESSRKEPLISSNVLSLLENEWKDKEDDFRRMFNYAHLLGKKKISKDELEKLEKELKDHKKAGAYWQAVLVNKCLIELYWIQANIHLHNKNTKEEERHLEQVVLHLNRHSRQYRLMGDSFHAKRSYERAEKIIDKKITSNLRLKIALKGYTEIVKGEYFLQRVELANLLESVVAGELKSGREKFEKQFSETEEKTKEKVSALKKSSECLKNGIMYIEEALNDDCWNNQSLSKQEYENKLSEAYFMTGDIFLLLEQYSDALDFFEKCLKTCPENEDDCRLDDAKQSCLSVFYFSSGKCGSKERCQEYEQELEEKIQAKDYSRPWVAARFRITQGDVLFSECYEIDRLVYDSSYKFKKKKEKIEIERKDLLQMFQKYIEACNYKAGYNELSFEAGLRVLRRRIEMIPDPGSLDTLYEIFRQLWQNGEHLQKKKEELDSILQLIRLRKLIL